MKLQLGFQRNHPLNRRLCVLLSGLLLIITILMAPAYSKNDTPPPNHWVVNLIRDPDLPFNPKNTRWSLFNNDLTAASLTESGTITIWTRENGNWTEALTLSRPEIHFTSFQIQDSNNDDVPEIIAGTSDPGYICIFEYQNGSWNLRNSEKYVWSSVANLSVGKFDGTGTNYILVQNREGYLFLFSKSGDMLDLVWKSPSVWRFFESVIIRDIDGDHRDEVIVSYQNGSVAILKMINKSITSVWENYLWGKVIALTDGDWDNDGLPEIIFSTTQKIIYFLGGGGSGFRFEAQVSQFGFTPEQLAFLSLPERKELLAADTSGKFHILDCDSKTKKWIENTSCAPGRIAQIVVEPDNQITLWGYNQSNTKLELINPGVLKLRFQSQDYSQDPGPLFQNSQWLIAPRALSKINDLGMSYQKTKTAYQMTAGTTLIEVALKIPNTIKINGKTYGKKQQSGIFKGELYFTADFYREVFNLDITTNLPQRCLEIQKVL